MNRSRALLLAILAVGLAAPAVHAATIRVTTPQPLVVDNDELCSIEEAVLASLRATELSQRTNARFQIENDRTRLESNLVRLSIGPDETFPKGTLQGMIQALQDELVQYESTPTVAALIVDVNAFKATVDALVGNARLAEVEAAIALQTRSLEALDAEVARLRAKDDVDGCDNGSAFDVILLDKDEYCLDDELVLTDRITLRGAGADDTIVTRCNLAVSHRLFRIASGAPVEIELLALDAGDAGTGDGGALLVDGTLNMRDVMLRNNVARDGGALHVSETGSLVMERGGFEANEATRDGGAVSLRGNRASFSQVAFGGVDSLSIVPSLPNVLGNIADGRGGAVFVEPDGDRADIEIDRSSFIGNRADAGSAVHAAGANAWLLFVNTTFAQNVADSRAALDIETTGTGDLQLLLNNVSMLENWAPGAATGGIRVTSITGAMVTNSVVADNTGGSGAGWDANCDFSAVVVDDDNFTRNYYGGPAASACPGVRWPTPEIENANFELAAVAGTPPAIGYLVQPLNEDGVYVPVFPDDLLDSTEIRLVNRGASTQDPNRCEERDQRGFERASFADSDCDIGAVEYQVGRRADDVFNILVNQSVCLDVVRNDVGDALYIAGSLEVPPGGVERAGATWEILLRNDPAFPLEPDQVAARCPADSDVGAGNDAILFTPPRNFQGETIVTYRAGWETSTTSPDRLSGEVVGWARVITDSRGGIGSSKLDLGAGGLAWLLLLLPLAWRRRLAPVRTPRLAALLVLVFGVTQAQALENIIYVNSGSDALVTVPRDTFCTLREALNTARNDQANLTLGDCRNGNEGPDVIEFLFPSPLDPLSLPAHISVDNPVTPTVYTFTVTLSGPLIAYGGVTLRCPQAPADQNYRFECLITRPNAPTDPAFALIDSLGGITVERMILANGDAGVNNDGGAINSRGGVVARNSVFRDNVARTGGAIFLRGLRSDLAVYESTFERNESTGVGNQGGGAIATSAGDEHQVKIRGSTFVDNRSAASAAALRISTVRPVVISNSTFSGNQSTSGAGAIDVSGASGGITLRNLTIVDNLSGDDGVQRGALEVGTRAPVLANSVVAANYATSNPALDANCGAGAISSFFSLYGESFAGATCLLDPTDSWQLDTDVFGTNPLTDLLGPLQDNGGDTMTHAPNTTTSGGIILDAGYNLDADDNLVDPLDAVSPKCAETDQRGVSRRSGGRCDIGAVEFLQATAVEDVGSNIGRRDRTVVIDLLKNDIADPDTGNAFKQDCPVANVDTPVPDEVHLLDGNGDPCLVIFLDGAGGTVTFLDPAVEADEELIGFPTESAFVFRYASPGNVQISPESPRVLRYQAYTESGVASNDATISLHIENVPPITRADRVVAAAGAVVRVDVLANDLDYDGALDPASVIINDPACKKETDAEDLDGDGDLAEDYWRCQFGYAFVDPATGVITWTPYNRFNPFTESFSYQVSDLPDDPLPFPEAETRSSTGTVTIVIRNDSSNGGSIFGDDDLSDLLGIDFLGSAGHGLLLALGLLSLRRRR